MRLRLIRASSLSVILVMLLTTAVFAIDLPTAKQVYPPVEFYRNLLVTGDTLVIGRYNLSYTVVPTEAATQAYLLELVDSTGNVTIVTQPVNFYNKGYSDGAFSMYLPSGVTWGGAYTIRIQGNPTLAWTGVIPLIDMADFTWNTSNSGIGTKVLTYASLLETSWGAVVWDLVTPYSTGNKLTTLGSSYFTQVIPNLRTIAPEVFPISEQSPQFQRTTHTLAFETELLGIWDLTAYDTYFTNLSAYIETSAGVLKLIVFAILFFAVVWVVIGATHTAWSIPILTTPTVYFGNVSGLLPLGLTMLYTSCYILLGVFVFFYKRTST